MTSSQLALLALGLGLAIGVAVSALILVALQARERQKAKLSSDLPEGVDAVLAGLDDAAAVVDPSFLVKAASPAADWTGMALDSTVENAELRQLVRDARTSGVSVTCTLRLRRGGVSGEERLVAARAIVVTPRLTLVTARDISEQERVEQMRQDFVANTSHELKTPVGAVTLLAEAIESAAEDPDQVRIFATRLTAEAQRLAGLTNRIMNLSRLQASDDLNEVRDVSIDEVVAAAADAHALLASSSGVEVVRGGTRGLWVKGDRQILTEALGNLVANAIAYSPEGSRVGIGVKQDERTVEIAVSDQGIGIGEADQQRIFERFYRADQARSRRTGGTGLGLSIVKHAVQRHGGDVRLWSRPGRGSTFTVVLPLSDAPTPHPEHKKRKKAAKKSARKKNGTNA